MRLVTQGVAQLLRLGTSINHRFSAPLTPCSGRLEQLPGCDLKCTSQLFDSPELQTRPVSCLDSLSVFVVDSSCFSKLLLRPSASYTKPFQVTAENLKR